MAPIVTTTLHAAATRLNPADLARLDAIAHRIGGSRSAALRHLIRKAQK